MPSHCESYAAETFDCFDWYGISDLWLDTRWMFKTYSFVLNVKANSHKALSDTVLPHRGMGGGIGTGNLQVLCFPFIPLADRWCSTDWWPAPDTTFWNHRKQVPAQAAACVQHPLPVPGSRPPTNVWCKYYLCPQFPSFWEFRELIILRWNILVG